jgi:hypothetical protein
MLKNISLCFLFFCFACHANAARVPIKSDTLIAILKNEDIKARDGSLIKYIKSYFYAQPLTELDTARAEMRQLLTQYDIEEKRAFEYFIKSICEQRKLSLNEAERSMLNAINAAAKTSDKYLPYYLFSHLGFLQTYKGNTIEAVSSFRMAKKQAIMLQDDDLQIIIDVNISDIYYKNNLYNQSLVYLNQAEALINKHQPETHRLENIVYFNKAETYFRMKNIDSLKKYRAILHDGKRGEYKLYIFKHRTNYFLLLLQRKYDKAIKLIRTLQKDTRYWYGDMDDLYLADAYYNAGIIDSAKAVIQRQLIKPSLNNHPEIKYHLYDVLGELALQENNPEQAAGNYKMALQQLEEQVNRLTQVGDISSQMRIDEMQAPYIRKEEAYKRQRLWLVFTLVVSLLSIAIGTMLYRNIKQKRYYEKLLYTAKKEELAFINSHEVRRHLSNILGLIYLLKHSKNKEDDYHQAEVHLQSAAEDLDEAIKNISQKLDN